MRLGDIIDMLPYLDEVAIVEMTGHRLLQVLENGVSMYPKKEGRWMQVRHLLQGCTQVL